MSLQCKMVGDTVVDCVVAGVGGAVDTVVHVGEPQKGEMKS